MPIPAIKTVVSSQKTCLMTYRCYTEFPCIQAAGAIGWFHCKVAVTRNLESLEKDTLLDFFVNYESFVSRDRSTVLEVGWHNGHPGNISRRKNSFFVWPLLSLYKIR